MSVINSSTRNMLVACAVILSLLQSPQSQARNDEWAQRCHKEYRDKDVSPTKPNQSVTALESYLACVWVFIPGDGSDSRPRGDGGINIGPGISLSSGSDVSDKTCPDLDADIDKLSKRQHALSLERQMLDTALNNAIEVADRARTENRAAQTVAAKDQLDCRVAIDSDDTYRNTNANKRCKKRGLHGDAFQDCVDLAADSINSTPFTTDVFNTCHGKAVISTALAQRTENAERETAKLSADIFDRRTNVARELGRLTAELKRYRDEKKNRCP
ncbi:MAG: hypothetical protein ABI644_04690 [Arenimonas sp.]